MQSNKSEKFTRLTRLIPHTDADYSWCSIWPFRTAKAQLQPHGEHCTFMPHNEAHVQPKFGFAVREHRFNAIQNIYHLRLMKNEEYYTSGYKASDSHLLFYLCQTGSYYIRR